MTKQKFIKSPMNYIGGKYKLLPQLTELFPKDVRLFVDLFTGGGNVVINVEADERIANDKMSQVVDIYKAFKEKGFDNVREHVLKRIEEYGLSKENKEGFLNFRKHYNGSGRNPLDLFVLLCYSFNNQIRFNSTGEYNMPFGKDRSSFNPTMEKNLYNFIGAIKDITFTSMDFRDMDISRLCGEDFVYCDPPYLITCASYNEQNGWTEEDETSLLLFLDRLNDKGVRFGLSNVMESRGRRNDLLSSWAEKRGYTVNHLSHSYSNCNYHLKDKGAVTDEVLVTNY